MKGIVFTEFLDMVEGKFGIDMVDDIVSESRLSSGGAYTSIGTYDHRELLELVRVLSARTKTDQRQLIRLYGHHLFGRFSVLMPVFFEKPKNTFEFLRDVHGYIHVEVKKLYPDASLPEFRTELIDQDTLKMTYFSKCPFADFAYGLITGCIAHFKESFTIEEEDQNDREIFSRIFTLKKI